LPHPAPDGRFIAAVAAGRDDPSMVASLSTSASAPVRPAAVQALLATEQDFHRLQRELVRASLLHCPLEAKDARHSRRAA
jgi:hypothetical protein